VQRAGRGPEDHRNVAQEVGVRDYSYDSDGGRPEAKRVMALRIPGPHSPEEVRRAFGEFGIHIGDAETAIIALDGRVDVLEEIVGDYSAETDDNVVAGQPVYVKADTHVGLAANGGAATHQVAGLASEAVAAGAAVEYRPDGALQVADWTAITGGALLTPGSYYFLDAAAGTLTTAATTVAGEYLVRVGRAISTVTLDIEVGPLILL